MSCDGGLWLQHTSKGKRGRCGYIWINFGTPITFRICGYQNLTPVCTCFLGKLVQTSFKDGKAWITCRTFTGSTSKNSWATIIVYSVKLGRSVLIELCQRTFTLVWSPCAKFDCCVARIVGLISTRCTPIFLPGINFENTWWQRQIKTEKIVQHAPLEYQALMSPFQVQVRLFWEEYPFLTYGIAPKAK